MDLTSDRKLCFFRSDGLFRYAQMFWGAAIPLVWRKHMGVEPISRPTRERDSGFEDRERHRPPSASAPHVIRVSAMSQYKQVSTPSNCEFPYKHVPEPPETREENALWLGLG